MKRFASMFLQAAALAAPVSAAAQAANHVSWGLDAGWGARAGHAAVWNPFVAAGSHGAAYLDGGGRWSLSVSFGGLPAYHDGFCGWAPGRWSHGLGRCGAYGHGHLGCGPVPWDPWGWDDWSGHGGFLDCGLGPRRHGHRGFWGRRAWDWPLVTALAWPSWRAGPFVLFVHRPFVVRPHSFFWYGADYWAPHGYVDAGHAPGVVGRAAWTGRRRDDRPVRRSPLFGPRYKEAPRVYTTDNGPHRPTSRAVPRVRDSNGVAPAPPPRGDARTESVRKAKPRNPDATARRAPRPGQRGPAARAVPRAAPRPQARPATRGSRPQVKPATRRAPPQARPATRGSRPQARPATRRPPPQARPATRGSRPQVKPATRGAPSQPRPATRRARPKPQPVAKRPSARAKPPAASKRPPVPRRPAKRGT